MILTDRQIREACKKGQITIEPFDENQIEPASYDLRIGGQGATTSTKKKVDIKETGYLLLAPGDFGVITTFEEIRLNSQHVARFGLRSKYARKGLIATTGPQIDPGYHGRLIVGLTNLTPKPVTLPYKDDFLSVEFHRLEEPVDKPYSGPYQGRTELGAEEIEFITESEGMALSEVLTTLRSLSANVAAVGADMKAMKFILGTLVGLFGIGFAIMATIFALK